MSGKTVTILNPQSRLTDEIQVAQPIVQVFDWADDDTHIAYDANSMSALQIDKKLAEKIRKGDIRGLEGTLGTTLAPKFKIYPKAPTRKIVFNVTHGCNLKCGYCFAARYGKMPKMKAETAIRALAMFPEDKPIAIAFFGGEPTLCWDVMMKVSEHAYALAKQRKVRCKLHVTTNGTQIDNIKAASLKRFGYSVLLSLDGPEQIHNAARPAKRGNSWKQTMRGLDALNKAGIKPMIRATFSAKTPHLVERLKYFAQLYDEGKIAGASVEPVVLSESCNADPDAKISTKKIAAEWHAAAEWFVNRIKSGKNPFPYFYFQKLLRRILECKPMGTECGAGKGYLSIGPNGDIFACHRETHTRIGNSETGFEKEARQPWLDNRISQYPDCESCWAKYLCGGGCRQARLELGGGICAPMPKLCELKKAMMAEAFWIAAQLTKTDARRAAGLKG